MVNENITARGDRYLWNPHLVSSITTITGSRLASLESNDRPSLCWLCAETIDVQLILDNRDLDKLTLRLNSKICSRSETEMRALRDLARQHNLTFLTSGDTDEN
jgi:hypothetical protein